MRPKVCCRNSNRLCSKRCSVSNLGAVEVAYIVREDHCAVRVAVGLDQVRVAEHRDCQSPDYERCQLAIALPCVDFLPNNSP